MKEINVKDIVIDKYYPLIKNEEYMHNILTSGRAGTKSSGMSICAVVSIISGRGSVVILRKRHNKLQKTVYQEVLRAIPRLGLKKKQFKITKSPMQITYLKTGMSIFFTGSDNVDDTKGMIDADNPFNMVVLDELTEFFDKGEGEDELTNITATFIRGNNNPFRMFYLFNPPKNPKAPVMEWVRKMEQRPDTIHIHNDYREVPEEWLGKMLIQEAEQMKAVDETMYKWLWLGECTGLEDLIYYMFNEEEHIKRLDTYSNIPYLFVGCDYGQMNATTFECYGLDYSNKMVCGIDEYYYSGRESGKQKSPSEYAKDFKEWKDNIETRTERKVLYLYIDPSARGLAEEIKRVCPEVTIKGADNNVMLGINRLQKLLSFKRIVFSPLQTHLKNEMYLYGWNTDSVDKGKEVPIKEYDHCLDGTRYAMMEQWKNIVAMLPMLQQGEKE